LFLNGNYKNIIENHAEVLEGENMEYIPVFGLNPSEAVLRPTTKFFENYLVSIAEPTQSRSWSLQDVYKHTKHMVRLKKEFQKKFNSNLKLMADSGGYQIIVGYISKKRIKEFIDVYHLVIESFYKDLDFIFSLDVNSRKFTKEELIKFNDYSIDSSIEMMQKHPEVRNKQLFVVQSRTPSILEDWLELMDKHKIFDHYDLYSLGGLVGLKKETNVHFNHFVPMTIWLLGYIYNRRKMDTPFPAKVKQVHMLGQSSRVAIITGAIIEKLFGVKF
jgi:hypothetical protein